MKRIFLCILLITNITLFAQNDTLNEFKIGMFGFDFDFDCTPDTTISTEGNTTSQLKVLSEDGFNIVYDYFPCRWALGKEFVRKWIKLAKDNDLQIATDMRGFYKSLNADYNTPYGSVNGINIYNTSNNDENIGVRPNFDMLIDSVYSSDEFRNTIWGHQITEEASFQHIFSKTENYASSDLDFNNLALTEVPVSNVDSAIAYFKQTIPTNQKLFIMEAKHKSVIKDFMHDPESPYSYFQTDEYLRCLKNKPDIFFEGSYAELSEDCWCKHKYKEYIINPKYDTTRNHINTIDHYLGIFKNIDWAYKYVPCVHKVVETYYEKDKKGDSIAFGLHSSPGTIKNANFLRFKVYNSIVHNAKGIWFWDLRYMRDSTEEQYYKNSIANSCNKFKRENFPHMYQTYVAPLARELRYLVNKNLLNSSNNTIIASKTDGEDLWHLFKPYKYSDFLCINMVNKKEIPEKDCHNEFHNENEYINNYYNIRYSLRTNGTQNLLIVTNPIYGASCSPVFTLKTISQTDDIIRNSKQYKILFEYQVPNQDNVNAEDYKTDRIYNYVNLDSMTICPSYIQTMSFDTSFQLAFGPLDTHILLFDTIDNQFFDERLDTTTLYDNRTKNNSPIITDNDGNIYYIRYDNRINYIHNKQTDWLDSNIVTFQNTGFDIDKSKNLLYYVNSDRKLAKLNLLNKSSNTLNDNNNVAIAANSRLFAKNKQVFCMRTDGKITATNNNGTTIIVNQDISASSSIGFTVNNDGNIVYFQGTDNNIYKSVLSGNSWETSPIYEAVALRPNSNLHCNSTNLYCIKDNGVIHTLCFGANTWHLDHLNSNAKVKNGTDIYCNDNVIYYIGYDSLIYKCENHIIDTVSPTKLVLSDNHSAIYCDKGNIYYNGLGNRIHKINYRYHYYDTLDLYIKDSPNDIGNIPSCNEDVIWNSPDIRIEKHNQEGVIAENIHGNEIVDIVVTIRNKSSFMTSGNETLKLNWAKAGTALQWPESWNGTKVYTCGPAGLPTGNIVKNIYNDSVFTIERIPANGQRTIRIPWQTPNTDIYAQCLSDYADSEVWHYCLIARIDDGNPISNENNSVSTDIFVRNNNNVAWKNLTILSPNKNRSTISISNPFDQPMPFRIYYSHDANPYGEFLTSFSQLTLKANDNMMSALNQNNVVLTNLTQIFPNEYKVNNAHRAIIDNIILQPNTTYTMTANVNFIASIQPQYPIFDFDIVQSDITGNIIGGEHFTVLRNESIPFNAVAHDDIEITSFDTAKFYAEPISENATYIWRNQKGDTIGYGLELSTQQNYSQKYFLEVKSMDSPFIDYDSVSVKVKDNYIVSITPNPATNNTIIEYHVLNLTNNRIDIVNQNGLSVLSLAYRKRSIQNYCQLQQSYNRCIHRKTYLQGHCV